MNEGPGEGGVAYRLPASRDNEVDVSVSKYGNFFLGGEGEVYETILYCPSKIVIKPRDLEG